MALLECFAIRLPKWVPSGARSPARQTDSLTGGSRRAVRHSGRGASAGLLLVALLAAALTGGRAVAQTTAGLEIDLRSGRKLVAQKLIGDRDGGYRATVDGRAEVIAPRDLVAVRRGPARAPELLRIELVGGERLFGALVGGDANGDELQVLSPVLGKQSVPVDRLAAVVQPGVHPGDQLVPDGVDEALFVPTRRGFDLVAGTLFRFGEQGLQFQADGREEAVWYAPRKFSSLRLRGGVEREQAFGCTLLTRSADRLGVRLERCTEEGVEVTLESGDRAVVRWLDVGCLVFEADLLHLSDLQPSEVVERGFDGEAVLRWRRDRSVAGGELLARGRAYGRGLGVHSWSRLSYVVPEGATHFRAGVAMDDSVGALPLRARAAAKVLRNGEPVFEVEDLAVGQPVRDVGLHPVSPGDTITLEVDFGVGRDLGDRVDWLLPVFLTRRGS